MVDRTSDFVLFQSLDLEFRNSSDMRWTDSKIGDGTDPIRRNDTHAELILKETHCPHDSTSYDSPALKQDANATLEKEIVKFILQALRLSSTCYEILPSGSL